MKNNALQYSFKVWVTSVVVSPFLFSLILMVRQIVSVPEFMGYGFRLIGMYLFLVVFQLLFSFVTWLSFLLLVKLISLLPISNSSMKLLIFLTGILLAIGTFAAINTVTGSSGGDDSLGNLAYANCAGIGWGVWYYRLNIATKKSNDLSEEQA